MKILKNEQRGNSVTLEIEASVASLNAALDSAFQKVVKSAKIPGFRKGKIPRSLFEKHYGEEPIIREAITDVVNNLYSRAVQELELEVIDYPRELKVAEYKALEPLVFSCEVDVLPTVSLGTYKGLGIQKATQTVNDDAVQKRISELQEQYGEFQVVDQPAKEKDIVTCDIKATINGEVYERWTRENTGLELGRANFGQDFDAQVLNQAKGTQLNFVIDYPEASSNPEVAGKTVHFEVEVKEVRAKVLPELNSEFVEKISKFKTVEEFTQNLRQELQAQLDRESEDQFYNSLIDEVFKTVSVDIHPKLVEREIDRMISELEAELKRSGIPLDRYLMFTQKTKESLRNDYIEAAQRKVKTELVLDAIAKAENIQLQEEDLINEVRTWNINGLEQDSETIKAYLSRLDTRLLSLMILRRKAMAVVAGNTN